MSVQNGILAIAFEPRGWTGAGRILSTQVGFELFRFFFTPLYFSTAYQLRLLPGDDWTCTALSMELLQFFYRALRSGRAGYFIFLKQMAAIFRDT
jgi:hypothetical protein